MCAACGIQQQHRMSAATTVCMCAWTFTCIICSSARSSARRLKQRTAPSTAQSCVMHQIAHVMMNQAPQYRQAVVSAQWSACSYSPWTAVPDCWLDLEVMAATTISNRPGQASGRSHFAIAAMAMLAAVLSFGRGSARP